MEKKNLERKCGVSGVLACGVVESMKYVQSMNEDTWNEDGRVHLL